MKRVLLVAAVLFACTSEVLAVGDDGPNMLGFYFDSSAIDYYNFVDPFNTVEVYLILTNPTLSEITGWEAGFDNYGSALVGTATLPNEGVNSLGGRFFSVTYPTPIPCSGPTVLMSVQMIPTSEECNCIRLFGIPDPTIPGVLPVLYLSGGNYQQVQTCVFEGSDSSAQLNGDGPVIGSPWACEDLVAVEQISWGAIKELFR